MDISSKHDNEYKNQVIYQVLMEAFELARDKFRLAKKMMFDKDSIEIATPEIIANYRSKRLSCDRIIDLCCGIGGDTISLAGSCKNVVAIDKNEQAIGFAKHNCKTYGKTNVTFVQGNALALNLEKFNANYVFSDPTRRVNGSCRNSGSNWPSTVHCQSNCFDDAGMILKLRISWTHQRYGKKL